MGVVALGKGEGPGWEVQLDSSQSMHVDGWGIWVHGLGWMGLGCVVLGHIGALCMGCTMGLQLD